MSISINNTQITDKSLTAKFGRIVKLAAATVDAKREDPNVKVSSDKVKDIVKNYNIIGDLIRDLLSFVYGEFYENKEKAEEAIGDAFVNKIKTADARTTTLTLILEGKKVDIVTSDKKFVVYVEGKEVGRIENKSGLQFHEIRDVIEQPSTLRGAFEQQNQVFESKVARVNHATEKFVKDGDASELITLGKHGARKNLERGFNYIKKHTK